MGGGREGCFGDAGDAPEMLEKGRRVERLTFPVAERAGDEEPLTGAREGDVTEIAFVSDALKRSRPEIDALALEVRAVGIGQQPARRGCAGNVPSLRPSTQVSLISGLRERSTAPMST